MICSRNCTGLMDDPRTVRSLSFGKTTVMYYYYFRFALRSGAFNTEPECSTNEIKYTLPAAQWNHQPASHVITLLTMTLTMMMMMITGGPGSTVLPHTIITVGVDDGGGLDTLWSTHKIQRLLGSVILLLLLSSFVSWWASESQQQTFAH